MPSRQLLKLRKQQELASQQEEARAYSDDHYSPSGSPVAAQLRPNFFSGFVALAGNDDDDADDEENEQGGQDGIGETSGRGAGEKGTADTEALASKKGKRSKKKKKGKKMDTSQPRASDLEKQADIADEVERALKELDLQPEQTQPTSETISPGDKRAIPLRISPSHLKAKNEMRRLFGKEVIEATSKEGDREGSSRRRNMPPDLSMEGYLRAMPGKPIAARILKRNPFVEGRKTWPSGTAGGLAMVCCGDPAANYATFAFSHNKDYWKMEEQFLGAIQRHDPTVLVHFCREHPYHVSTLIQLSKVAKQEQNNALANDLCERALFTFGSVTLSGFRKSLEAGKARMEFARPENRQFFLAGYLYIKNLIQKGTFRTALEWTKLFLSLAPEDPYGFSNWIHALAIRAHEARWFIDLCESDSLPRDSAPLARQTIALARLQLNDNAGAKAFLVQEMEKLPWLYSLLFGELRLDVPRAVWGAQPRHDGEELHAKFYIHMTKDLWNNPRAISLLNDAAKAAVRTDPGPEPTLGKVTLGMARLLYLEGNTSLMALLPHRMLHAEPNYDFDPLPPSAHENIFSNSIQRLPWARTDSLEALDHWLPAEIRNQVGRIQSGGGDEDLRRHFDGILGNSNLNDDDRLAIRHLLHHVFPYLAAHEHHHPEHDDADNDRDNEDDDFEDDSVALPVPGGMAWLHVPGAWVGDDTDDNDDDADWYDDFDDMDGDDFGGMPDRVPAEESERREDGNTAESNGDGGDDDGLPGLFPTG